MGDAEHRGLSALKNVYAVGVLVAFFVILAALGSKAGDTSRVYAGYAALYLAWGGLVYSSAYLAVKKGRECVEGAILGAFGPVGFVIEVLLPGVVVRDKDFS